MMSSALEVCCDSLQGVRIALEGGATRLQLCSYGGTTPSTGFVKCAIDQARQSKLRRGGAAAEVLAVVRPRPGSYQYTSEEQEVMLSDIKEVQKAGARGVLVGMLTNDNEIDVSAMKNIVAVAKRINLSVTFHRAIDFTKSPVESVDKCLEVGVDRIFSLGSRTNEVNVNMIARRQPDRTLVLESHHRLRTGLHGRVCERCRVNSWHCC